MDYIHHCSSPLGGITLAADEEGLTGLWFDGQKYFAATLSPIHEEKRMPASEQAEEWLNIYFSGNVPDFTPPLHLRGTAFRKAVWDVLLTIPYGQTMTYWETARVLALRMGLPRMSARAVGAAIGRNPVSLIIPCHRVIGRSGSLTGYAGGLGRKARLLELEKADLSGSFSPRV